MLDDDPNDRALVIRALKKDFPKLQVEEVIEAKGLKRTLEKGDFDLVITDYQLFWTDGLKNLNAVKERWPDCPVIMFTGTGTEEIAVEAMKSGLDDYVLKSPKHFARLPAAVRSALEKAEQRRATKEAEKRYRNLFNRVPVGIFRTTPEGKFLNANPALVAMLGYQNEEELRQVKVDELYVDPADRKRWQNLIEREGIAQNYEMLLRRRDGKVICVRESARAIRDNSGRVLYYEGTLEDITERKRLEEQLRHSQKMEALGRVAGEVAHDFNNLLASIRGLSDLLLFRLGEEHTASADLKQIADATDRAAALTKKLMAFGRRQESRPRVLNLNETISNFKRILHTSLSKSVELITDLAPELGKVKADPGQIEQVIMNLTLNARDAMTGKGTLTIKTSNITLDEEYARRQVGVAPGPYVLLSASDTGCGMEKEIFGEIFEPFFTTKKEGEGNGLGLSIIYGIIKQSGGHIEVESRPGKGTTFKIYLPRV